MVANDEVGQGRTAQRIALGSATLPVLVGVLVLVGYSWREQVLTGGFPGWPPVPPLTAAELVLAGVGLLLVAPAEPRSSRHRAGGMAGVLVAAIAAIVLFEYLSGLVLVDRLLFPGLTGRWTVSAVPGRPSLHMAAGLFLVGMSLALLDTKAVRARLLRQLVVAATPLVGVTVVLGSLYGADYIRRGSPAFPGSSPSAGLGLLALGVGIVACRPERPPGHVFAGRGPGGQTMRRLAPTVTAILVGAVLLTAAGNTPVPIDTGVAVTAATALVIVSLYLLFLRAGEAMDAADRELRDERDYVRTVLESLREGVITTGAGGEVLYVTPRWCEITGYAAGDVLGIRPPYPWWPPAYAEAMTALMGSRPLATEVEEVDAAVIRPDGVRVDVLLTFAAIHGRHGAELHMATYRDLTERKAAEADRRRMADQVDHFFEMSGDLLCIAGRDGYFKRLNPAWEHALGFTLDELMSRPYREFVHPDDFDRGTADAGPMITSGVRMVSFENRYRCRDGSYRWLNWSATLAEGEAAVYGVARDTTAQREAERSQAFLAAIVGSTDDAVIGKTLDGTIVSWNDAAERMYGYSAAEAIGRSIRILTVPEQAGEIDKILERIRRGERVARLDSVRRRADGSRVRVGLTISPIHDKDGAIVGAASIARDVTAQVAAEQRFRRLVQAAPDAMIIVDGTGKITLANDQTGRLFGYPSADLIGVSVEQLVPPGARARHIHHREDYLTAPHNLLMGSGMELYGLRRDGTEFPIEISLAPLQTDEGTMIAGAIRDISQRREVEQALASARDAALAASKLKSQFVAMVSHEIRTPMNGVIGLTGLLLGTDLDAGQRRYAEAIRTSGRALLAIINDILDFSKIEAGKINIVAVDFDLAELLDMVMEVAVEAVRGKEVEVDCYYPPDLSVAVRGDDGRLRQTLLNLVGNAVKFTERGQVILRADPAPPAGDGSTRITFAVIDTGVGIAPSDLPRLFEPFTQVDGATSRQFGGTGLGLTISRQFVELMGGELTAQSEPGKGSRFAFTLPLARQDPQPPGLRAVPASTARRVLVVDAHATRRRFIAEHASSWGLTVTEAIDERQALGALGRHQDIVIADDQALARGADLVTALGAEVAAGRCHLITLAPASHHDHLVPVPVGGQLLSKPVSVGRLYDRLHRLADPPHSPAEPEPATAPRESASGARCRGRVLLAEDNRINQLVARDLLDILGFDCDLAQNGIEVLRLAETHSYQAILMDCQMPGMDGYAATAALRRRETPDQHIPIIAMTAGALAEDREQCFAAGMDDYLAKPIEPEVLRAALERWTSGSAVATQH